MKNSKRWTEYVFVLRLPWNQDTVFGWIGMMILAIICSVVYAFLNCMFILLFASICNFHKAFYLNSKHLLNKLDELTDSEPVKLADLNKIATLLCEIMNNGIKGKEWGFIDSFIFQYIDFLFIAVYILFQIFHINCRCLLDFCFLSSNGWHTVFIGINISTWFGDNQPYIIYIYLMFQFHTFFNILSIVRRWSIPIWWLEIISLVFSLAYRIYSCIVTLDTKWANAMPASVIFCINRTGTSYRQNIANFSY